MNVILIDETANQMRRNISSLNLLYLLHGGCCFRALGRWHPTWSKWRKKLSIWSGSFGSLSAVRTRYFLRNRTSRL